EADPLRSPPPGNRRQNGSPPRCLVREISGPAVLRPADPPDKGWNPAAPPDARSGGCPGLPLLRPAPSVPTPYGCRYTRRRRSRERPSRFPPVDLSRSVADSRMEKKRSQAGPALISRLEAISEFLQHIPMHQVDRATPKPGAGHPRPDAPLDPARLFKEGIQRRAGHLVIPLQGEMGFPHQPSEGVQIPRRQRFRRAQHPV